VTDNSDDSAFASDLSVADSTMIVGSPLVDRDDVNPGNDIGRCYIYQRTDSMWSFVQAIDPPVPTASGNFGSVVAAPSDTTLIIRGATVDRSVGLLNHLYVYDRDEFGAWQLSQTIALSSDATDFRSFVAQNSRMVVASSDYPNSFADPSIWVYERNDQGQWIETAKIVPQFGTTRSFGNAFTLDQNTIAVTGDDYSDGKIVYIYEPQGNSWSNTFRIIGRFYGSPLHFGDRLALSEGCLMVGDVLTGMRVEVFDRISANLWFHLQSIRPAFPMSAGPPGSQLAMHGTQALIGAGFNHKHIAMLYVRSGDSWVQAASMDGADLNQWTDVGDYPMDLSDNQAILSSPYLPTGGTESVEVYNLTNDSCDLELDTAVNCGSGIVAAVWRNATPNGRVVALFGRDIGTSFIPDAYPCAGTQLGLAARTVRIAVRAVSRPDGTGGFRRDSAGSSFCGGYLQIIDSATCTVSNTSVLQD